MHREKVDELAVKIWDCHLMRHQLKKSDCIVVLGSHDIRVAERGAQLFLEKWSPSIVFSGGLGRLTKGVWDRPEAEKFAEIAISMGVPEKYIFIENESTNTGENVRFTKDMLNSYNLNPTEIIAVHKPYMERRTFATFKKIWPEVRVIVSSPQLSFDDYVNGNKSEVINIMVGDLQRIKLYAKQGFQTHQEIPDDVWDAYRELIKLGYTKHLIR